MSTDEIPIRFRKKRLQAYRGRGQLYSWLRAHRETIARGFAAGKLTWPIVCGECGRHGVMSREGAEPSQRAAAKAWQTVVQDLAASGLKPTDKVEKPIYPSRMAKWTPPAILEAVAAGILPASGSGTSAAPVGGANAVVPSPGRGLALREAPPPPIPSHQPAAGTSSALAPSAERSPVVRDSIARMKARMARNDEWLGEAIPTKKEK